MIKRIRGFSCIAVNWLSRIKMSTTSNLDKYDHLNFKNTTLDSLPIDSVTDNYVRTVRNACFALVNPTPVKNPSVIALSKSALELIDINFKDQDEAAEDELFAKYFSGSKILPGSKPAAHVYCGHQFGSFAGQLGDGAAIYLGEIINQAGDKWELQLKGAGLTPFSRTADGRKVLRSSIREFLASEFMAALGVPTTRAGSVITSDDTVIRDIFYDGHPIREKVTIVSRIAPTFIRFGSFEIFKTMDQLTGRTGPSVGRNDIKKQLLDFVVNSYYKDISILDIPDEQKYQKFFQELTKRTAHMVAHWQTIGFCHGVLNTDNMSIVGLTIDYGPYGFMERYDPDHICNGSDDQGRYSFQKQPSICKWNLMKLSEVIDPLVPKDILMEILESTYDQEYKQCYEDRMRKKIGLVAPLAASTGFVLCDSELFELLFDTMAKTGSDFTETFKAFNLTNLRTSSESSEQEFEDLKNKLVCGSSSLRELIAANDSVVKSRDFQIFMMLLQQQPNMLTAIGLSSASIERMMSKLEDRERLKNMTQEDKSTSDQLLWQAFVDKYKVRLEHDIRDVTDKDQLDEINKIRKQNMENINPVLTLRNSIAQKVIEAAEQGDYDPTRQLLNRLMNPFKIIISDSDQKLSEAQSSRNSSHMSLIESFYQKSADGEQLRVT